MSEDQNLNRVTEILKYSNEQFDKNILFIASGALGVSFAFIKDIVPELDKAHGKNHLICSWYIFASVIFISLLGHFLSMQASRWAVRNHNLEDDLFNCKLMWWNIPIRTLNIITIIAILIGAIQLITFINLNI